MQRRSFLALFGAGTGLLASAPNAAQPLRLIVPAPAGGMSDMVARTLAQAWSTATGKPVIVDNRPGAGGALATDLLLSAPRDGSTLMVSPNSIVTELPHTIKPRYDPFEDLVPVAEIASTGLVLVVDPALPVSTLPQLLSFLRGRSNAAFASFGHGTISHLKSLQLCHAAGLVLLHVGHKGSPPALLDVSGGRVAFMFDGISTSAPLIASRKLKALAVTLPRRSELLPDVPTLEELGHGSLTQTAALTLFAASKVPEPVVASVRREALDALADAALMQRLTDSGLTMAARSPSLADLQRNLRSEYQRTGEILRKIAPLSTR
jgi:tripartite-type tricarboxylate transporter receptor subunit TctC